MRGAKEVQNRERCPIEVREGSLEEADLRSGAYLVLWNHKSMDISELKEEELCLIPLRSCSDLWAIWGKLSPGIRPIDAHHGGSWEDKEVLASGRPYWRWHDQVWSLVVWG